MIDQKSRWHREAKAVLPIHRREVSAQSLVDFSKVVWKLEDQSEFLAKGLILVANDGEAQIVIFD
ncbi:MAG: hypothetical protein AAF236_02125 [Verrucomicrobiota bacterium]